MSQNYGYEPNQQPHQASGQVPPAETNPVQGNPATAGYQNQYAGYQNTYASYGAGFGTNQALGMSKPRPHVSYGQAHRNWFKYMFHFTGRASRSEYWWVQLTLGLVLTALVVLAFSLFIGAALSSDENGNLDSGAATAMLSSFFVYILLILVALASSIMSLGLTWRRMQDAGFPGWLALLSFAGLGIVPTVIAFFPSKPEGYQYDGPKDFDRP